MNAPYLQPMDVDSSAQSLRETAGDMVAALVAHSVRTDRREALVEANRLLRAWNFEIVSTAVRK